ncbi:amino acid aminotransferase [Novosphingobium sp. LASN5T]|uniref:amino acid aminotransferase n=1 Tax=Novosphingobium sp. LASN5T TaxID=2491021 RepID=UPI000F5DB503|nr:amino acid aminotransferase [Novosphingobium sp. LASN5T]RQW42827.1 aspartate/tyrosine/aromatic aminotransferase [Novosphingobium sp. LASN5T]
MTLRNQAFAGLEPQQPDGLLALIAQCRADPRPDKVDVGVGVYRGEAGGTPVMRAVKAAEAALVAGQASKSYLGAEGDERFARLVWQLVSGEERFGERRFGLQTPGGTGALRVGAELMACARPGARIWLGEPTWPNHEPIFSGAGLEVRTHPYFDATTGGIAFDAMISALSDARQGDVLLLHGCCHNPTGTQFSREQWRALSALCNERGVVPFIDLAYQGLGDGMEEDAWGTRLILDTVPDVLLAYSCDKNFAMYRDRVGALFVQAGSAAMLNLAKANALTIARRLWSMPPDHGAAVVGTILDDPDLRAAWQDELTGMRQRLQTVREKLAAAHPVLALVAQQRGLFSRLPIAPDAVAAVRRTHGIYMPDDGRINIAGLNQANLDHFVEGVLPHLIAGRDASNCNSRRSQEIPA